MNKIFGTVLLFFVIGCSTGFDARGVFHRVRKGENLFWIARSYGVNFQDLAEINNIQKANEALTPGVKLYIPPRRVSRNKKLPFEEELARHVDRAPDLRRSPFKKFKKSKGEPPDVFTDHGHFAWPVKGAIISGFGIRRGRRHDGVDIKAPPGSPVMVADSGRVVYAGVMRGYGNLILVRHPNNFFTAYAHNRKNLVKKGEKVKRGETIAFVGRTGRATGPHLHFEVREGEKARNPLFFLPVLR